MRKMMSFVLLFCLVWAAELEKRWEGFERPLFLAQLPTDESYLIVEQGGKIFQIKDERRQLVLNWGKRISRKGNEEGLLGLAVSPDFETSGHLYLNLSNKKKQTEIWRVTLVKKGDFYRAGKSEKILSFGQPFRNHNGGWMGFGPDQHLYIATGDGGAANDPKNFGQDLSTHLGKILRIAVIGEELYRVPGDNPFLGVEEAKPEIFAYGLRNPWRCSWDIKSQTFFIGDVGQRMTEEVNRVSFEKLKGANFGWRLREGGHATPEEGVGGDKPREVIDPIYSYPHDVSEQGGFSITGGYLYKGSVESLKGKYILGTM